jgi:pimeloyl-ACP methyl ester carboxylesterase
MDQPIKRFSIKRLMSVPSALLLSLPLSLISGWANATDCVILLHGLARTADAMKPMAEHLESAGYQVANVDYPSREHTIDVLAEDAVSKGLEECQAKGADQIFAVTHSLGGILIRYYLSEQEASPFKRVVMLGPPNHGSEVVDHLKNTPGFELLNGPAGMQLGTDESSIPTYLSNKTIPLPETGIIAGTSTFNPILSTYLPNPDDGKVSVESAKLPGMCSFLTLPTTHTFMMRNEDVLDQVVQFLQSGEFRHPNAQNHLCARNGQ